MKHTINFIASSISQEPFGSGASLPDRKSQSSALSLSLEIIAQASKVLSSVPSSLSADTYFTNLAPQLLQLLDGQNEDDQRAAAYIIGNGILGRRKHGSPGTIGWRLFAQPILEVINPALPKEKFGVGETTLSTSLPPTVVSEASLQLALNRLISLVILHPNPGLTKRLIDPCVLSMWDFMCYSREFKRFLWSEKIQRLLCTYFKTSVSVNKLLFLSENLLHDEASPWVYGAGTAGGIELRQKSMTPAEVPDIYAVIKQIDLRISEFVGLLRAGVANDDDIATLFAHVCKNWLLGTTAEGEERMSQKGFAQTNALYSLVHAKLSREILKEYKDKIAASPRRIIEFLSQFLLACMKKSESEVKPPRLHSPRSSSAALETIAIIETLQKNQSSVDESSKEDYAEMISTVISLLAAVLSSPEFSLDPETFQLLNNLQGNIDSFTSSGLLPTSLITAITNVSALLGLHISFHASHTGGKPIWSDPYASDRKEYDLALSYLTDALPPIRAQGLSQLTSLIEKTSPVLDIQSTTILLQSLLQDEDEFIYLSAIKALSSLAARHPKTVFRMLVEGYIDPEEKSSVDVRLRIGEALLKTIETLADVVVGETAKLIGESMITVAGRRASKPKHARARDEELKREESARREAEEAWGGEVPSSGTETQKDTEQDSLKGILNGWQGRPGADDLRVRASALSILGTCIETSLASLGSLITSSAIDLGLSILLLETGPEAAILRRAAVLLILSLARALDAIAEVGRDLGPGFGFERRTVQEVMEYLRQVGQGDADEIVRGHSEVAVEALETWIEKTVLRGVRDLGKGLDGWGRDLSINNGIDAGDSGLRGLAVGLGQRRDNVVENHRRIEEIG